MAQAAVDAVEKPDEAAKDSEKDEKQETSTSLECAVCLQPCIHPAKLPCTHIFCYLCVKGVANQSKKCPMCRQEIPADFIERPELVDVEDTKVPGADEEYQWFYEGRNGWWQYDPRTSLELETAYKQGKRTCELLIAGFLYIADFGSMLQLRRNDPSRHRRIKRDLHNIPKKGIAGLRLNRMDDETVTREIRGAERPASPASDTMGTGDGTNTPVPPSNTPQTPAGNASGDATPLIDRNDAARQDSLHQVLEQMRSLMLTGHFPLNTDNNDVDDTNHDAANFSDNTRSLLWIQSTNLDTYEEQQDDDRH